jgi:hypothetical protein
MVSGCALLSTCNKREESWPLVVTIVEIMVKQTASVEECFQANGGRSVTAPF